MPEKKSRQYLIDIQKWRSLAALAACVVTLVFSVIAINKYRLALTRTFIGTCGQFLQIFIYLISKHG